MDIKANKRAYAGKKICAELIETILEFIEHGSTNKHAAEAEGVSERTFYSWLQQGTFDLEEGIDSLHAHLVQSLRKIERDEITRLRQAVKYNDKSHKGAEWTLEHVYWKYFGSSVADMEFNERLEKLENQTNSGVPRNGETNSSETQENT